MAQKKYAFIRVYKTTKETLDNRAKKVNEDLKIMGINRSIPKIKFMDEVARRLTFISDRDLIKLAKRKTRKC